MTTTQTTATKLGFVGLGHMGGNMAARYLAAGFPVYGEARSRERAQRLVDESLLLAERDGVDRGLGFEHRDIAALFQALARDRPL
jgi:hypothetical protein